jgi:peptide subunit release factor 1 (eRF1)
MITADTVSRIRHFPSDGLPVVSLYARVDPGPSGRDLRARVSSLLDEVRALAKDTAVDREHRLSLRGDIARIKEGLSTQTWRPGAMAIFACAGRGLYAEVPLPQPVADRITVDATPYVRPMLAVLEEHERSCVAVIDRATAWLGELYQDEVRELGRIRDPKLRKPNYAVGLAEDRVRNKAEELAKRHYRRVAEQLTELLRDGEYALLIVGGHGYEVPEFLQQLPRELRARVAGTFSVDPGTAGLADIRSIAGAFVRRHERERDQRLVSDVLTKAATGGLATLGLPGCLWAGSVGAIQTLLVQNGVAAAGVVCNQSGWLALSGASCPLCGSPTRHTPDVIDELTQVVMDEGGAIHHIDPAQLGDYLTCAGLRFPLPSAPEVRST